MNGTFRSEGFSLARHLVFPGGRREPGLPGFVLCHGFPTGPIDARRSAGTFPELVERISNDLGWAAMTFTFRGCGDSEGSFSFAGWMTDLRNAVDHLETEAEPSGIWLCGTSTGGSLAVCVAAGDLRIRGVAMLAGRADFDDWARHPRRFLEHARDVGAIRDPAFPPSFEAWAREVARVQPLAATERFAPRPLLVIHGADDDVVPEADARQFARAHGEADLRLLGGAGHRLRHDPRAVALLLGWLDRQRTRV